MKILYLVTDFNLVGGKERYDRNTLGVLSELGARVDVLKLRGISFLRKIFFALRVFFRAAIFRPDFIFCAHISFSLLARIVEGFLGIPYVVFTHGREVFDLRRAGYKKNLQDAVCVVSVSRFTAGMIESQIPELSGKVFILPNVLSADRFFPKERPKRLVDKHRLVGTEKIILTVARLYPSVRDKGHYRVIDALPIIKKEVPDIRYVLVGSGLEGYGDDREEIKKYADNLRVLEDLVLPGGVSDEELAEYYNLCDVFVMPSTQEGFGVVFLEALASGKPVIASNADGSREAVLDGETGILVDPRDVTSIAHAIIDILKGRAPAKLYNGIYLRNRIFEAYGPDVFKRRLKLLLKTIEHGL